MGGWT